ncbi:MAG: YqeG family HAD IIIA-type phosphatase [Planctomycetaceae bacterium]|jgi:HAD superfamily phosphatase (TIGR01668 family)|nr:YqeG family HAD IIIA-type phosphatase [Planctomycetaceae bacterium]
MSLLTPDIYLQSVAEVSPELLQKYSIRSLLLDVDSTLKRYKSDSLEPEAVHWLETMKRAEIGLCILSNGKAHRIRPIAELIQVPFVAPALKPLPVGCKTALTTMNFDRKTTAMVGDQVFADLLAGKLAGLFTILVKPIHPEEEHWYTRIKRPLESFVLGQVKTGKLRS